VLSAPLLWTHIELYSPPDIVSTFLTRSQACTLEVHWDVTDINPVVGEDIPEVYVQSLNLAIGHVGRWQWLIVNCCFIGHVEYLLKRLHQSNAESLQHVQIFSTENDMVNNDGPHFPVTINAPALSSMDINGYLPVSFPSLTALTTLILRGLSDCPPLLNLLCETKCLENLTIHGTFIVQEDDGLEVAVIMHSLWNLRIFVGGGVYEFNSGHDLPDEDTVDYLTCLTSYIVAPNLESLMICHVRNFMFNHFCKSLSILLPFYLHLKNLELSSRKFDTEAVVRLILATPRITHANFEMYFIDEFLTLMEYISRADGMSGLLWPQLQVLTMNNHLLHRN
jgi:hypothetical protein